ncbi:MAG: hypothetical protein D6706_13260 [Chloroflexi bacterium]|nr:MAG: hypothetical protein D6706_13260 [Chloroflexota bacterium]
MTHAAFETPLGAGSPLLRGTISAAVHEHGGVSPTTIIRTDTPASVHIKWRLEGPLASMICGKWHVHVNLESIGPGREYSLFDRDCQLDLNPGGDGNYECHFDIPPGTVRAAHQGTPYKMVVTLTYRDPTGRPGPMAAYYEGPILQFFNP